MDKQTIPEPIAPKSPSLYLDAKYVGSFGFSEMKHTIINFNEIENFIRNKFSIENNDAILLKQHLEERWFYVYVNPSNKNYANEMAEYQIKLDQYKLHKLKYDLQENMKRKRLIDAEIKEIKSMLKMAKAS
jgi:hypothetical protein